jgi:hypothetical protein
MPEVKRLRGKKLHKLLFLKSGFNIVLKLKPNIYPTIIRPRKIKVRGIFHVTSRENYFSKRFFLRKIAEHFLRIFPGKNRHLVDAAGDVENVRVGRRELG